MQSHGEAIRRNRRLRWLAVAVVCWALGLFAAASGEGAERQQDSGSDLAPWIGVLDEAESYLQKGKLTPERTRRYQDLIPSVRRIAGVVRERAHQQVKVTEALLAALGPPPAEGAPAEAPQIQQERSQLSDRLQSLKSRISQADLALARVDAIEDSISAAARGRLLDDLTRRYPVPLLPTVIVTALPEIAERVGRNVHSPIEWYEGLTADQRAAFREGSVPLALALVIGILVAWVAVRLAMRRLGPDPSIETPAYARKLLAAVVSAVAMGVIPAAIVFGLHLFLTRPESLLTGRFLIVVDGMLSAFLLFILATAIIRAVFVPRHPEWGLTDIAPENARRIARRITLLAAVVSLDLYLYIATLEVPRSAEVHSFYFFVLSSLQAAAIASLAPERLWARTGSPATVAEARSRRFWWFVRTSVAAITVLALIPMLLGYTSAGRFVFEGIIRSAIVVAAVLLIRTLVRETIEVIAASGFIRRRFGLRESTGSSLVFWLSLVLDPLLTLAVLFVIAPFWGVPSYDLWRWVLQIAEGVKIGDVVISPLGILSAAAVFVLTQIATRFFQRALLDNVLPKTRMALSTQYTLVAGISYVGFALATVLAITIVGIDLTNLAIVLGALSVGIGFGLQNVVNNFVSGLILLVERPIKVGDWVIVAGLEGLVKRINIRATEIETFQKASVVVPNAEVLSQPLTNLTLRDLYGRVQVDVGVAYGSDTDRVREILLECARAEPSVVGYPSPWVLFRDFGESSLDFRLFCFTDNVMTRLTIESNLRFAIDRRFREENIEIPFPQRVVHFAGPAQARQPEPASPDGAPSTLRAVAPNPGGETSRE
jgi:small-conductance mechanosensitive channel